MKSKIIVLFMLIFSAFSAMAWEHGVSFGYGGGSDINHHTDTNSGEFLSGDFATIKNKHWVHITGNASLGNFYSVNPTPNKNLFTAALSVAFRFYLFNTLNAHPYFFVSVGPSYMSNTHFGRNRQASNFAFQSILGLGTEVGQAKRLDLSVKLVHYSNAFLMHPNEGYNIFYIGSVGYLFN